MTARRAFQRLLALVRRRRLDGELQSEIEAHLEMAERDAISRGLSPQEARRAARRSFGAIEAIKEEHRDRRSFRWIDNLLGDFRYGLALLVRNPAFAVAAIGILALGIGANTAMFSIVDAVLLKPLPFPEPERMVTIIEADGENRWGVSAQNFVDWKRLSTSFEAFAAESHASAAVTVGAEPERWTGLLVTADYFKAFGVKALLGRTFAAGEDQPGAARVVMLSYSAWQSRFGSAEDIVNRDLLLDGERHRVIGVLPLGSFDRAATMFWKPLVFTRAQLTRETMWLRAIGRLRAGLTLGQAREEMRELSAGLEGLNPTWKKGWRAAVDPFGRNLVGERLRQTIYVAFGAVVMVLLIACSNIGNLLMARGAAREKEMAVRAALGAGRGRLAAQLLAESLALCILGGFAGIVLAQVLVGIARPLLSRTLPATAEVNLDLRVLAFAGATVLGVSLLAGLVPALQASSRARGASLNQAARGFSSSRSILRRVIVVGEVAISLMLICGATLMFRSLLNLQRVDAGVRIENIIRTSVELPEPAYPSAESAVQFSQALVERLRAIHGVDRATVTTGAPLEGLGEGGVIVAPGLVDGVLPVRIKHVDEHYFGTLDIPVLSGRGFDDRDRRGAPRVVVLNQEAAAGLSVPDPVGRVVGLSISPYATTQAELAQLQVVGVIRSERVGRLAEPEQPVAYLPIAQEPSRFIGLILRTQREAPAVMPDVRQAVRDLNRSLPLGPVSTMQEVKEQNFTDTTQSAWAIGAFATVAALLAAFGLYGVLAQAVTQQRREIGIRMALGARPRNIVSGVVRNAAVMVLLGLAIGLAGAIALTGAMKGLLFHVSVLDPAAFATACASMILVGLVAVSLPAARAAHVDPVTTLREDG